jgi:hypothetical protein
VDSVPLTTGKDADFLLLVGAFEVELRDVARAFIVALPPISSVVVAAADLFVDRLVGVEVVADWST